MLIAVNNEQVERATWMPEEVLFETVNFSMIWLATSLAAYFGLKHKNPFLATGMAGIIVVNCLTHLGSGIAQGYNVGLATTVLLLVPIAVWCLCVCYGKSTGLRTYNLYIHF